MKFVKICSILLSLIVAVSCSKDVTENSTIPQRKSTPGYSQVSLPEEVADHLNTLDWEGEDYVEGEFQYEGYGSVPFRFVKTESGTGVFEVQTEGLAAIIGGSGQGTDCVTDPFNPCPVPQFMPFNDWINGVKECPTWWCAAAVTIQAYEDCFNATGAATEIHCW